MKAETYLRWAKLAGQLADAHREIAKRSWTTSDLADRAVNAALEAEQAQQYFLDRAHKLLIEEQANDNI
jgi:hypothetical protein